MLLISASARIYVIIFGFGLLCSVLVIYLALPLGSCCRYRGLLALICAKRWGASAADRNAVNLWWTVSGDANNKAHLPSVIAMSYPNFCRCLTVI
jgi:hypothetical protein